MAFYSFLGVVALVVAVSAQPRYGYRDDWEPRYSYREDRYTEDTRLTEALVRALRAVGDRGSVGEVRSRVARNINQCQWNNLNSDVNDGKIVECEYNKASPTSALRLIWNGAIRTKSKSDDKASCNRWYLTVNGEECKNPAKIDGIMFTSGGDNHHRVSTIDGLCYDLPTGPLTVALNVEKCHIGDLGEPNAYTGYASRSRIIVEELNITI